MRFLDPTPASTTGPADDFVSKLPFPAPGWLIWIVALLVAIAGLAVSLKPLFGVGSWTFKQLAGFWRRQQQDEKAARQRGLFADHLESQLRRISEKEDWRDSRFAELEAEVEIEGEQRRWWPGSGKETLRRVKSLSRALERSTERLIVLEGEPGSGKSIAMRHVAQSMARRAMRKPDLQGVIPLYINLRELRPDEGRMDGGVIRDFVLSSLNRANNRDVDRYLADEFDKGLQAGTWLFLFDSFDEIPEVLSATEYDAVVERYADALYEFLHTMNTSRGVIASREFRGPRRFGWPRFTIVRLTKAQKLDLIRRADLRTAAEEAIIDGLATADPEVARLADNPMLLGMLCEHVRDTGTFPDSSHAVFETYVNGRVTRDADMVRKRFDISPSELREVAEEIAFCIADQSGFGLSPTRAELRSYVELIAVTGGRLDQYLDALEYIKLARAPEPAAVTADNPFAFAHRRFQEYFATCIVLRDHQRVPMHTLLTDGRWRETAVTVLQTHTDAEVNALLAKAEELLLVLLPEASTVDNQAPQWSPGLLHLLDLLNTGLVRRRIGLRDEVRERIGQLLRAFWLTPNRIDRKSALSVVLLATDDVAQQILEEAFQSRSSLLREVAYQLAGRMRELPASLEREVARTLVGLSIGGRLRRDRVAARAQLRRLDKPQALLDTLRLLIAAPYFDAIACVTLALGASLLARDLALSGPFSAGILLGHLLFYPERRSYFMRWRWGPMPRLTIVLMVTVTRLELLSLPMIVLVIDHGAWGVALGLLAICVALWPRAAFAAAMDRKSGSVWRWPLLPFLQSQTIWRSLRNTLRKLASIALSDWLIVGPSFLVAVAVMGGSILGLKLLMDAHPWMVIGLFVLLAAGALMSLVTLLWTRLTHVVRRRRDGKLIDNLVDGHVIDADGLIQIVGQLRTDDGLRRLVSDMRRRRIGCTAAATCLLAKLPEKADDEKDVQKAREAMAALLGQAARIQKISDLTMDEIVCLVEESRSRTGSEILVPSA